MILPVNRYTLGCREYVARVVSKLFPALENDLTDWLVETKIKASSLAFVLTCHLEEAAVATQHADKLLKLMSIGAKDDEPQVVKNVGGFIRVLHHIASKALTFSDVQNGGCLWTLCASQNLVVLGLSASFISTQHDGPHDSVSHHRWI